MTAVEKLRCRDSELPDAQIPLVNLHLGLRTEWELKGPGLSSCWPATSFRVQAVVKDLGIQYLGREIQKLPVLRCAVNIERANQTNLVRRSPFGLVRMVVRYFLDQAPEKNFWISNLIPQGLSLFILEA